ncbi:MAG: (d)CMP kinase [Bacilli bacterium]|nr:(d)CMP kinase [Bacilli bacterium]
MKKINIAIDGLAGSGKSSVAKVIAKKLGYTYIDTGSMYRCVAYLLVVNKISPSDDKKIQDILDSNYDYSYINEEVFLNGENVTVKIRTKEVNEMLPKIVPNPIVRSVMVQKQQEMGKKRGVIMDGRDIASVVLKDAELKIYQVADLNVRADRRYKENLEKGITTSYEEVLKNLEHRDYVDTYVSKALVKVEDAIVLDTTNMSFDEVVNYILKLVEERV